MCVSPLITADPRTVSHWASSLKFACSSDWDNCHALHMDDLNSVSWAICHDISTWLKCTSCGSKSYPKAFHFSLKITGLGCLRCVLCCFALSQVSTSLSCIRIWKPFFHQVPSTLKEKNKLVNFPAVLEHIDTLWTAPITFLPKLLASDICR